MKFSYYQIYNIIGIVFFLFLSICELFPQEVVFSRPQKIPNKISEYEIIGKTEEGLVIHKWGDRYQQIEVFDEEKLKLKWTKELQLFEKKDKIIEIIPYKKEMIVFFTSKRKNLTTLYAYRLTADLRPIEKPAVIDTVLRKFGGYGFNYEIKYAKNRGFFAIVRHNYNFNGLGSVDCVVMNKGLQILKRQNFSVPDKVNFLDGLINNDGVFYLILGLSKRTLLSNTPQLEAIYIKEYDYQTDKSPVYTIEDTEYLFNDAAFQTDELNDRLVLAGFYSEKQVSNVNGYFSVFVEPKKQKISDIRFQAFDEELKEKLNRKRRSQKALFANNKEEDYIHNLKVNKLFVRKDGGALLIGESHHATKRSVVRSTFDNYKGNIVQVVNHYHDDIVVLSIHPDGTLYWGNILPKRQYSEEDNGYFASFGLVNTRNFMNFIFNEEISYDTNVNAYSMDSEGTYKVKGLLSAREYQIMVAPRYGKQMSSNEVIIPAFNHRNEFLLTKVTF